MRRQLGETIVAARGLRKSLGEQFVLTSLQAVIQVRLESNDAVGGDQTASLQLALHPIRSIGEDDLEPARLREQRDLAEREDARCVHAGDASQVEQQEPDRAGLRSPADPLEESPRRSEEHEPIQAKDLDPLGQAFEDDAVPGGRSTLLRNAAPNGTSRTRSIGRN